MQEHSTLAVSMIIVIIILLILFGVILSYFLYKIEKDINTISDEFADIEDLLTRNLQRPTPSVPTNNRPNPPPNGINIPNLNPTNTNQNNSLVFTSTTEDLLGRPTTTSCTGRFCNNLTN